jgi:hypothetical protein
MKTLLAAIMAAVGGWVPAPSAPWDAPAGTLCDFSVHGEPVVDEVRKRVLDRYPDGSTKLEAYTGDLVVAVTNTETGKSVDADASGSGLVEYTLGGALTTNSTWYVVGPAGFGFTEGGGNRPRGIYVFDGVYTVKFGPTGYKTVTMHHGTERELCTELS